jgi:hypothetical protein
MKNLYGDMIAPLVALKGQIIKNTNETGKYYKAYPHNSFVLGVTDVLTGKTAKLEILQATDSSGTGAKAIEDYDGVKKAESTISGRQKAYELNIEVDSVTNGKTVILKYSEENETVTYTKKAADDIPDKEFKDAAGLVLCINAHQGDYLKASASGTDVTVAIKDQERGGHITESGTQEASKLITTSNYAITRVTFNHDCLDSANGFIYIAAKVITDDAAGDNDCVVMYHRDARHCPDNGNAVDVRLK